MKGHILLVDDNPNDIELTLMALEPDMAANGSQVTVAQSGLEALQFLAQHPYDLILLDLNMPHMDGLAVLGAVKAKENLRDIPVVMLTTSAEPGDIERCYQKGANAYVVKPLDFEQFSQAMRTVQQFWMNLNRTPRPA